MSGPARQSCIYTGWVRHRRFVPGEHHFTYPIFMAYLDLDELPHLLEKRWYSTVNFYNFAAFWRKDYFQTSKRIKQELLAGKKAPDSDLKKDVIEHVQDEAQARGVEIGDIKSVRLLTHLRYFNVIFNPVSFYYCYDEDEVLLAIVAEITNTPWEERHSYTLFPGWKDAETQYSQKGKQKHRFEFEKVFHVSPFNPMNMRYRWNFSQPDHKLFVHMDNLYHDADQTKHFDATLSMTRKPFSDFGRALIRYPLMTVSVAVGIYWQAFRLWLKKAPFYDHPDSRTS